jgi:hypothetical protein
MELFDAGSMDSTVLSSCFDEVLRSTGALRAKDQGDGSG